MKKEKQLTDGSTLTIEEERTVLCPTCGGGGDAVGPYACRTCHGLGEILNPAIKEEDI